MIYQIDNGDLLIMANINLMKINNYLKSIKISIYLKLQTLLIISLKTMEKLASNNIAMLQTKVNYLILRYY